MSDENHLAKPADSETKTAMPTQDSSARFQMPYFFNEPRKERPREQNSFDYFRDIDATHSVETPQEHGDCYVATVYREFGTTRYPAAFVQVDEVEETLKVFVLPLEQDMSYHTAQITKALGYALGTYKHITFK